MHKRGVAACARLASLAAGHPPPTAAGAAGDWFMGGRVVNSACPLRACRRSGRRTFACARSNRSAVHRTPNIDRDIWARPQLRGDATRCDRPTGRPPHGCSTKASSRPHETRTRRLANFDKRDKSLRELARNFPRVRGVVSQLPGASVGLGRPTVRPAEHSTSPMRPHLRNASQKCAAARCRKNFRPYTEGRAVTWPFCLFWTRTLCAKRCSEVRALVETTEG